MKIEPGTVVSSGTLRTMDLVSAFSAFLKDYGKDSAALEECCRLMSAVYHLELANEASDADLHEEYEDLIRSVENFINDLLSEALWGEMEDLASEHGLYFGIQCGDGACFGFWAFEEEEEEEEVE